MSLVRWTHKQPDSVKDFLNDELLWGFPFMPVTEKSLAGGQGIWQPAIDVSEDKDKFTFKADLPGMKKEDIRVSVDNGIIAIEGERKSEAETKERNYHRVERSYGRFVRSFNLGSVVDDAKINANYKDGVLEITVPKVEKAKAKTIDVSVN